MRPIATDVARSMVCVLGTRVSCTKAAERQMTPVGSKNHILDGGHEPPRSESLLREAW